MSEELRNRIKGIIAEELRKESNIQNKADQLNEALGVANLLGRMTVALGNLKRAYQARMVGAQIAARGAAVKGGVVGGGAALLYGVNDAFEASVKYTPADTTKAVLTPGAGGLQADLDKNLDLQLKRIYKELGIEPEPGEVFSLSTLLPNSEIGLSSKEVVNITREIRDAVETEGLYNVGTDEEAITSAIEKCRSQYGVSQVSQYYSELYNENLLERLHKEFRANEFVTFVTMPIDSLDLIEIDGKLLSEQEFFTQLEREINQAEAAEKAAAEEGDGPVLGDKQLQTTPAPPAPPPPVFRRKSLKDIKVIISDVPFSSKTYTLDQVYGEGAALEMAEKVYDTFTDDALRNGIATKKLNFTIKFRNGKARKGAVQLRDRRGLQGVFSSQTNIKMQILRWFKNNNRSSEIKEFDKLDGRIRGSVLIPGGLY